MKKRYLFDELSKYLNHKNALVITGMRQVGKTTLMKQLYEQVNEPKLWYDFENPLNLMHFENVNYDAVYELLKNETAIFYTDMILNKHYMFLSMKYRTFPI